LSADGGIPIEIESAGRWAPILVTPRINLVGKCCGCASLRRIATLRNALQRLAPPALLRSFTFARRNALLETQSSVQQALMLSDKWPRSTAAEDADDHLAQIKRDGGGLFQRKLQYKLGPLFCSIR